MPRKSVTKAAKIATPTAKPVKIGTSARARAAKASVVALASNRPAPIRTTVAAFREDPAGFPKALNGGRFDVKALANDDEVTIEVYDTIGGWAGVTSKGVRAALREAKGKAVRLKINSPGGSVFEAVSIYNDLLSHPGKVTVEITGLAASAASLIAMAGDRIEIADNAFFMIHNTWTVAMGDHREMAKASRALAKFDSAFARTYSKQTGLDEAEVADMMAEETWLDAGDAVSMGFAHAVTKTADEDATASFDLSKYVNAPAVLRSASAPAARKEPSTGDAEQFATALAALAETFGVSPHGCTA